MQTAAEFKAGFKTANVTLKKAVSDPERNGTKDVPDTRGSGPMVKGGQSKECPNFLQGMQKVKAKLPAACSVEKAACAKRFLIVSAIQVEETAQKKFVELTGHLAEKLSVWESSIAKRRYMDDAVVVKEKLI